MNAPHRVLMMNMAQRNTQGVAGIDLQGTGKTEQHLDHVLNLAFVRTTLAYQSLLDLSRGVFMHRYTGRQDAADRRSSRMTEFQRGVGILMHENLLDGQLVRLVLERHIINTIIDLLETSREMFCFRTDTSVDHQHRPLRSIIDDSVSGNPRTRVDT